jgi:uncharacterized protein
LPKVQATLDLLDEGNTVAFITRYRKDQTGGLDEEQIRGVQVETTKLRMLAERKQTILKSIESQGKLTAELAEQINAARSTKRLEDIYLPFKPKKQTLATIARQRGLEPFAQEILEALPAANDLDRRAADFVCSDRQLNSVAEVLHGVGHLLAERFSEKSEVRSRLRKIYYRTGHLVCSKIETAASAAREPSPIPDMAGLTPSADSEISLPAATAELVADVSAESADSAAAADVSSTDPSPTADEPLRENPTPAEELAAEPAAVAGTRRKKPSRRAKAVQTAKDRKRQRLEAAFKDYADFREAIARVPPHRVMAINRGERTKVLRVKVEGDTEAMYQAAVEALVRDGHPHADFLRACVRDSLNRLVLPGLEREIRRELTDKAEEHALEVFVRNLRKLLLQPPVRGRRVLALDPGFRSGCKLVTLDAFGNVLESGVAYIIGGEENRQQARATIADMVRRHNVTVVAIGNGTACRDCEQLVAETLANEMSQEDVAYVIVNEAGASVYSTSPVGREELPDFDAVLRSAVSIGRRLLDPLSELVKINPSNIGVGLYQHDVKAKHLRESLDAVVQSCVNLVGVDANTASPALLSYVSGLNQLTARRFYDYRREHGPFRNREQFRDVPGVGEATFIQSAGFLRIVDGDNPLDATWIHPESYRVALRVLEQLHSNLGELARTVGARTAPPEVVQPAGAPSVPAETLADRAAKVDLAAMARDLDIGELLLRDLLHALTKPRRDPRDDLTPPVLRRGVLKLEDLQPGMELSGTVLNVVDFGAFVDIGISDSALVHISRLADHFIRDPHEVVSVGDILRVWVVGVDRDRRRVALTAVSPSAPQRTPPRREPAPRPPKPAARSQRPSPAQRKGERSTPPPRAGQAAPPQKPRRPAKPKIVKPITDAMVDGREPMRSFSDLFQFFERKQEDTGGNTPPKS